MFKKRFLQTSFKNKENYTYILALFINSLNLTISEFWQVFLLKHGTEMNIYRVLKLKLIRARNFIEF